jgi:hypothetical protein
MAEPSSEDEPPIPAGRPALTMIVACTAILVAYEIRMQSLMTDLTEAAVAEFRNRASDPVGPPSFIPVGDRPGRFPLGAGVGRGTTIRGGPRGAPEQPHE